VCFFDHGNKSVISIISVDFLTYCTNKVNNVLCFGRTFTQSKGQVLTKHTASFISADVIILVDEQTDTHVAACDSLFYLPETRVHSVLITVGLTCFKCH